MTYKSEKAYFYSHFTLCTTSGIANIQFSGFKLCAKQPRFITINRGCVQNDRKFCKLANSRTQKFVLSKPGTCESIAQNSAKNRICLGGC